jgi:thioredoxin 1
MLPLMLSVLIGGALGAVWGYFGQCSSGTCPLTSTWWRGGLYGAVMGIAVFLASGRGQSAALTHSTRNVKLLNQADFEPEVLQAGQPVLVEFFAPWCGPCKSLAPVLDSLAGEFTGKAKFVKINVDEAPALSQRFQIQGVPTLVVFRAGRVADRIVGFASAKELKARLVALIPNEIASVTEQQN